MKPSRARAKGERVRAHYSTALQTLHNEVSRPLSRIARAVCATIAKGHDIRKLLSLSEQKDSEPRKTLLAPQCSSTMPVLAPGDILRDLPFFTQASEVSFISTHPLLCARIFGVIPGEVFEIGGGCAGASGDSSVSEERERGVGEVIVVVGARGGNLWVWTHGEAAARVLTVPLCAATSPASSAAVVRSALVEHYRLRQLSSLPHDSSPGEAQEEEVRQRLVSRVRADFQDLCTDALEEVQRLYTGDQLAFLQRTPDIYVAVTECDTSTSISPENAKAPTIGAHTQSHPTGLQGIPSSTSRSRSIYADIATHSPHTGAVILLVPHVVLGTGVIGWVGEGNILVPEALVGKGEGHSEASLSASVVIQGAHPQETHLLVR